MKKIILIKFGGSLITNKSKVDVAKYDVIDDLARQILSVIGNRSQSVKSVKSAEAHFIIATGAGGFGHPVAKKYEKNLEGGLPFIKKAVKKINSIVVDNLNKVGVKAQSVEPSKIAEYTQGRMTKLLDGYIVKLLEKNIIPVFHADLVDDKKLGITVLSMDRFLVDVAISLKNKGYEIEKVIFCGTTDGVIDRKGKTILKINKENYPKIKTNFYDNREIDISGGMRKKVEECLRLAKRNIDATIINGAEKDKLKLSIYNNQTNITCFE
jgi:isopentenyl phosphate kinase